MATGGSSTEDRLRRILYRRVATELRSVLRDASGEQLAKAAEAPTAAGSVVELFAVFDAVASERSGWAEELLRGTERKRALLEAAGGAYATGEAARLLGISPQAVQQRHRRGTLLAVLQPNGTWAFPACQFTKNGVPAGLRAVLEAFEDVDPWVQLSILLSADYGDGRIIDWVAEGRRLDDAVRIARSYGIQGAA
jgi:hypothetical protein